jgi:DNA segregation ATPase FtsK/SpoIIIE, S-DNA-T family
MPGTLGAAAAMRDGSAVPVDNFGGCPRLSTAHSIGVLQSDALTTLAGVRLDITLAHPCGRSCDVAVIAPTNTVFRDVRSQLAQICEVTEDTAWFVGAEQLLGDTPLGGRLLQSGAVLTVGGPEERNAASGAVLRLHVVGGPDSGRLVALPRGIHTVGRAPDCDLPLTDPDVSRRHASLTVTTAGIRVHDLRSTNGTAIDMRAVDDDGTSLHPGELIRVGDSFLSLDAAEERPAALRCEPDGRRLLNPAPRAEAPLGDEVVEIPTRTARADARRVQWIATLVPMSAAVALALALHSVQFLLFMLLSPLALLASALGDRLHWRRVRRRDGASFKRRTESALAQIAQGLRAETAARRRAAPDPATLGRTATEHGALLWQQRRTDPDALFVRLGLADAAARMQSRRGTVTASAGCVHAVPVGVDLRAGPLGVAAPRHIALGISRWLVGQLAVLHSPADVEIALFLSDDAQGRWTWTRWLPHLRGRAAATAADRARLVTDLTRLLERRMHGRRAERGRWAGRWLVLVVDGAGELGALPGLAALLAAGPAVGITAICLDRLEQRLPAACASTARAFGETGNLLRIRSTGGAEIGEPVADQVTVQWAEQVARALCPVIDSSADTEAGIPDECRLFDLAGIDRLDAHTVQERWRQSDGMPATVVGVGDSGPVTLNLVRDGPHALVAGTTGAGKSELLQTLIAGLALAHPPSAITFVLIDYKGGAAFADCARLPHVAGFVTDLDAHLTARALQSLDCELRRREQLFARAGVQDLAGYRAHGVPAEPLARLLLVVDEFAALAEELPEFISGLIAIASRGRSLGVHLVLATQRPGGVVSPDIRANTGLRIALRVSDPAESLDVIGTDAAADIDAAHPGRAFIRAGTSLLQVQLARVGTVARRIGCEPAVRVTALDDWRRLPAAFGEPSSTRTDLQMLGDAARDAAAVARLPQVARPWLPPLPELLRTAHLPAATAEAAVPFGLVDLPHQQAQPAVELPLGSGGSVLFIGSARSGRTSALVTLAVSAAIRLGADELQIYGVDCAGGALGVVSGLPHCGTLAGSEDFDVVEALFNRLDEEVVRRRSWLADLGLGSVAEARAAGHDVPLLLCLIDGWEGLAAAADEHDGGRVVDVIVGLLRTAASAGLTLVVTGDRATLAPRLAGAVPTKFLLRLADRSDYALAGISAGSVPDRMPAGRAIRAADAAAVQLAIVGASPSRAEQATAVARIAARARPAPSRRPPIRVRPLPVHVRRSELPAARGRVRLGLGGHDAQPITADLFAGSGRLLVSGPARSGRSTALHTLLLEAVDNGIPVVVAAPWRSPLAGVAAQNDITILAPDDPRGSECRLELGDRTLLLVDDSGEFVDTGIGEALGSLLARTADVLAIAAAGNSDELALTFRGVAAQVRRSRCALLLQPAPVDGELVGLRLPRRRQRPTPGRGLLIGDPAWGPQFARGPTPIQVALP